MEEHDLVEKGMGNPEEAAKAAKEAGIPEDTVESFVEEVTTDSTETEDFNEVPEDTVELEGDEDAGDAPDTDALSDETDTNGDALQNGAMQMREASEQDVRKELKASKRTVVVLAVTIAVLCVVILVSALLIINKIRVDAGKPNLVQTVKSFFGAEDVTDTTGSSDDVIGTEVSTDAVTDVIPTQAPKEYKVEVTLGEYKNLQVEPVEVNVTDEEVDEEIQMFLEDNEYQVPVTDRNVEEGDTVLIDYAGTMDGVAFEGGTDEDFELVIGSHSFISGFEEGLVGASKGEKRTLHLKFPEDYYEDMAGKDVDFDVTVKDIYVMAVPEFTDEFVAENTEYATTAEYREYVRNDLLEMAAEDAAYQEQYNKLQKLIENCTVTGDIDEEIDDTVTQYLDYLSSMAQAYYGVDGPTLIQYMYGMTVEQYTEYIRGELGFSIKCEHILDKIATEENIQVTKEEYDAEFNNVFVEQGGYTGLEEVLEEYTQDEVDMMVNNSVLRGKAQKMVFGEE